MFKFIIWLSGILLLIYAVVCLLFYLFQERFLFFPQKLPKDYRFTYPYRFEEHFIEVEEGIRLNALLIKNEKHQEPKGVILYLHGNAGALNTWGYAADEFLHEGYDVFIPDYRGYGKSDGRISGEKQLFQDVEHVFREVSKLYRDQEIIIAGFSIGSGPATWLASKYHPDMLILMAPFYNMTDLAHHYFPFLPAFIMRYPFKNNEHILQTKAPVVLIHGRQDEIIPFESTLRLKKRLKSEVHLFPLEGVGHNDISGSPEFREVIRELLSD